jgi:hypothetical protein
MNSSFLTDVDKTTEASVTLQPARDPVSGREFIKVLVIGSHKGVISTIRTLHHHNFAAVWEWSRLMPYGNSGEMMSILKKQIFLIE